MNKVGKVATSKRVLLLKWWKLYRISVFILGLCVMAHHPYRRLRAQRFEFPEVGISEEGNIRSLHLGRGIDWWLQTSPAPIGDRQKPGLAQTPAHLDFAPGG